MAGAVYIETTVPSAYVTMRSDPSSLHRRQITRAWWDSQLKLYDAWTSDHVELELEQETGPARQRLWVLSRRWSDCPVINRRLGLMTPQIVTPEMLWLEEST